MRVSAHGQDGSVWRLSLLPDDDEGTISLTAPGLDALDEHLLAAGRSAHCRVVTLEGAPGRFCAGMSLPQALSPGARVERYAEVMERLRTLPKVTICLVDGEAQGGGIGLVAAHDVVLATARSRFSLPECVLGLIPAMVMPLLLTRMPPQKARYLAITGKSLDSAQAQLMGLVDETVEDEPAQRRALLALLKRLHRESPRAIAQLKAHCDEVLELPCNKGLLLGAERTTLHLENPELRAALSDFLEGGRPPWFARPPALDPEGT